uniref:Reverse transcriptase domain-containing protein n=1 Tax=Pygocentrus nattereri TaxID=42514 RepID=A0AAR2IHE3_PYGNA
MFNKSIELGSFHRDANIAVISLLLKPGKDPTLPTSYRPLSLIGADVKLFAKILASRLEAYMSKLIHCDQTGFIKSHFSSDNVRRLLHVLDHTPNSATPCAILSLDAEKAFDHLDWNFLWSVLEIMGLGHNFINMIKILYSNPSATVITGAKFSSFFPILRGSRQGCPLSPFLFAISLEPLAQAIRLSSTYSPVGILNTQHYISLYADDILLFVNNVPQTLPHLLTILDIFGSHSGYKVNKTRSALLPLNEPMKNLNIQSPIPVVEHFKYLGIEIYPSLNKTVQFNYNHILEQVSNDLKKWNKMTDTFQTRISVIKMNILPRLNFIASMIPLTPPTNFWKKLNSTVSFYLWRGKRPRYKYLNLQRCKTDGGLSIPNFKLYYYSFVLRALTVWLNPDVKTSWRPVEECIVAPHRLQDFIYSNISLKNCTLKYGPVISNLLSVWRDVEKITNVTSMWHKDSPIFHNYKLLTANKPFSFPAWQQNGINTLGDVIGEAGLRTFQDLQSFYNLPGFSFFLYLRLRAAMKTYGVPWNSPLSPHPLQHFFYGNMETRGLVSAIYITLLKTTYKPLGIQTIWEKELKLADDQIDWQTVWNNIISSSKNPNHQLIHYHFVFKYYLTPCKRYFMHLTTSPLCTFCSYGAYGTFLHMFWECPKVYKFWTKVSSTLSEILGTTIPMSPQLFLLNDDSCCNLNSTEKKVWMAGTTVAKKLLALHWQPPHSLNQRKWILSCIDVVNLELSTARIHGAKEKTLMAWENAADMFTTLL